MTTSGKVLVIGGSRRTTQDTHHVRYLTTQFCELNCTLYIDSKALKDDCRPRYGLFGGELQQYIALGMESA
jgi:hypothetical protein